MGRDDNLAECYLTVVLFGGLYSWRSNFKNRRLFCKDICGGLEHCMNFGIYKTFTFHVNMPKDPLSSPLLGIYFTFAFKSKGLKGDLFVIFT